ncbi:winged helix-turn-helix transcriptional regulator [Ovoidimarina sediminis]|uniref:winged helix-turn-helix transcriptional regulator n=1 Tax=Ovoidimarina sediminis TaxID=3079856 RepID=UPI00290C640C|nr:helix-turn-helix domain-containing protein [Rhodophyticola sp. MJ-SS7]MDU8946347.1 helix-turn-helix domain-containing protein [Rhodophyticola sp. MJ-SS7]
MSTKPYGFICPINMAAEIIGPRWTLSILTSLWNGYTRFNDIRRATGNISPGVLSKRLADLEALDLIRRVEDPATGKIDYVRTEKGIDLEEAIGALARWAQRSIDLELMTFSSELAKVMWQVQKNLKTEAFPQRRVVLRFHFSDEEGPYPTYWIVAEPGAPVELCSVVPNFDVDLFIETTKVSFAAIILGRSTIARELAADRLYISGDAVLRETMDQWFFISYWADTPGILEFAAE